MLGNTNKDNKQLYVLSFIIVMDLLSACMTVPLFPILIIDSDIGMLDPSVAFHRRNIILGWLFGFYALAQFVGSPIIGSLSDRYGRKRILGIVFILNIVQYFLIAISIQIKSLELFFFARITAGLAGGTVFVEQSAMADISSPEDKTKNMGIVGAAFGFGLVLGPIISTLLSDSSIYSGFNLSTPFYAILVINTLNLYLLFRFFNETLKKTDRNVSSSVSFFTGLSNIKKAVTVKSWRRLFAVIFVNTIGFMFFLQFFQVFLIEKFGMTVVEQGLFLAYCGLWMVISQGLILRKLTSKYSANELLKLALPMYALGYVVMLIPQSKSALFFFIPFLIVFQGLCFPSLLAIVSNKASIKTQGETIGINQSVQSLASAIPAFLASGFMSKWINFPFYFGAATTLFAWVIFISKKNK